MIAPQESGGNQAGRDESGRFLPGVSGNPGGVRAGRPKGSVSLARRIRERLAARPDEGEAVVEALLAGAKAGDPRALRILFDRHDGPLAMKVEGIGEEEFRERLGALLLALKNRLPPEYWPAISEAAREGMLGEGGGDGDGAAA